MGVSPHRPHFFNDFNDLRVLFGDVWGFLVPIWGHLNPLYGDTLTPYTGTLFFRVCPHRISAIKNPAEAGFRIILSGGFSIFFRPSRCALKWCDPVGSG